MKTAVHKFFAFSALILMVSACKKPKQDLSQAAGLGFVNNTDKDVTVKLHTSWTSYSNDKKTKNGYTIEVPAGAKLVAPIIYGDYYVDWYSNDYSQSNWGTEVDSSFAKNLNNAVTFRFSETSRDYIINPGSTRATFLDSQGRGGVWISVSGIKEGVLITNPQNVKLGIGKNYKVNLEYRKTQAYSLFTNKFSNEITLTDSISQKYTLSVLQGPDRDKDTLLIKLPYTDTAYKLIKI